MHMLGKILAFLVVFVAIAASLLTAKLIHVRNSWTAKTLVAKNKFADLQPKSRCGWKPRLTGLRNEIFFARSDFGAPLIFQRCRQPFKPDDGRCAALVSGLTGGFGPVCCFTGFARNRRREMAPRSIAAVFWLAESQNNSSSSKAKLSRLSPDDVKNMAVGVLTGGGGIPYRPGFRGNIRQAVTWRF